ncbi:hypothetical protein [Ezakiella peruensis]|uniref:hypothetical protein n=1 Tax=Ezakiella peruensis TaxID=1464038 RepID=UPI000C1B5A6C|nr:hypothetical protein [Ezakiella peruensis]
MDKDKRGLLVRVMEFLTDKPIRMVVLNIFFYSAIVFAIIFGSGSIRVHLFILLALCLLGSLYFAYVGLRDREQDS